MSKENWLEAYFQVESEMPENTAPEILAEMASKRECDIEARKTDYAMDLLRENS